MVLNFERRAWVVVEVVEGRVERLHLPVALSEEEVGPEGEVLKRQGSQLPREDPEFYHPLCSNRRVYWRRL